MRRREFLKATTAATAAAVATPYIRPARADGRNDTLLTLSESGPNNLDIMGLGTNRPGYEASWNTHDRLVTFGAKTDANGVLTCSLPARPRARGAYWHFAPDRGKSRRRCRLRLFVGSVLI
jgi:hypothetical protein